MSALLQSPSSDVGPDDAGSDHKLVAAVRRGDDRAFEGLYERYHRRIHAYVFGMVKDHQRAEDVTQEVFVSALRRMRATERPIAFKPWIYEIAKNACIDQFRRSKRAEEVSYDAEEGLAPADYGRLVSHEPVPDAALVAKQQLEQLCGAFGGLSDAHHRILVLRELEGLSYREIGEKMGMSRPAVESTLFRARRRLTEEYDELASGQRCLRIQSIIANAGSGRLGARDTRRLARHVAHCQPCRREALAAGMDSALVARRPVRERVAAKVAALLPVPVPAARPQGRRLRRRLDQPAPGGLRSGRGRHRQARRRRGRARGGPERRRPVAHRSRGRGPRPRQRPPGPDQLPAPRRSRRRRAGVAPVQQESAGDARERSDLRSRSGESRARGGEPAARGQASAPGKPGRPAAAAAAGPTASARTSTRAAAPCRRPSRTRPATRRTAGARAARSASRSRCRRSSCPPPARRAARSSRSRSSATPSTPCSRPPTRSSRRSTTRPTRSSRRPAKSPASCPSLPSLP